MKWALHTGNNDVCVPASRLWFFAPDGDLPARLEVPDGLNSQVASSTTCLVPEEGDNL
jgi:hypothetical protein